MGLKSWYSLWDVLLLNNRDINWLVGGGPARGVWCTCVECCHSHVLMKGLFTLSSPRVMAQEQLAGRSRSVSPNARFSHKWGSAPPHPISSGGRVQPEVRHHSPLTNQRWHWKPGFVPIRYSFPAMRQAQEGHWPDTHKHTLSVPVWKRHSAVLSGPLLKREHSLNAMH